MKRKITKMDRKGIIGKAVILAVILGTLSGCVTANHQTVSHSLVVPEFSMVISSDEAPFMMGQDKNGAVYCFKQGMRMEIRGYKEEGKIFINPGSVGTHELQHILHCIDPDKYGNPDENWELASTRKNGVKNIAKRRTFSCYKC